MGKKETKTSHMPIADEESEMDAAFTALLERAEAVGIELADVFKDAEDEESLMMALVVTVSKCMFATLSRTNDCTAMPGFKKFLAAQEAFLVYFALSHKTAKEGVMAKEKAADDVEIN